MERKSFKTLEGPLIIAHRGGAWEGVPGEQTPEHFERAISQGADFLEIDLRETEDRAILCVHDPEYAGCEIARTKYMDLREACLRKRLPMPPRLEEVLALTKGRVRLDIEIKVTGFEERALDLIRKEFPSDQVIFKSFEDWVVRRLKTLDPTCTAGLLLGVGKPKLGLLYRMIELFPEFRLKRCLADFVSPHWQLVRFGFVRRMHKLGYRVLVWTLNEPPLIERFLKEADGVITDRVATVVELARAHGMRT